ncbi:MAG TPA: hypothetical protein PLE12_11745 [Propionicimonas sp.]|nr:hypothetical protein [Propionicimonas sp.]
MYGLRDLPPLAAKVQVTVAEALAGRASPEVVAAVVLDADAAEVVWLVAGAALEVVAAPVPAVVAVQPITPTMAAADSPQANARRVTAE